MGKKAKELAEKNRGATARSIEYVAKILEPDLLPRDRGPV
jgi:hypothetical protein